MEWRACSGFSGPLGFGAFDVKLKVCDLLGDYGQWDLEILSHHFLDIDVNDFQSILVGHTEGEDTKMWHFAAKDEYDVRLGYRLAMVNSEGSSLTAVNALCTWWNTLWKLGISSKVKLFIWKAFQEILPLISIGKKREHLNKKPVVGVVTMMRRVCALSSRVELLGIFGFRQDKVPF